jgi:hypothetical protein
MQRQETSAGLKKTNNSLNFGQLYLAHATANAAGADILSTL